MQALAEQTAVCQTKTACLVPEGGKGAAYICRIHYIGEEHSHTSPGRAGRRLSASTGRRTGYRPQTHRHSRGRAASPARCRARAAGRRESRPPERTDVAIAGLLPWWPSRCGSSVSRLKLNWGGKGVTLSSCVERLRADRARSKARALRSQHKSRSQGVCGAWQEAHT